MSVYKFNDADAPKPPAVSPRKDEGEMDAKKLQSIVAGLINDAETLVDDELSPKRVQATEYYHAEPFGNEEEGRSQVIITEVRDTLHGTLPSLMRIFFGPERCVELAPRTAAGVERAKQATDFIQYTFAERNAGFLRTRDVLVDGLLRQLGVFKWAFDESANVVAYHEERVTDDELTELASHDEVNLLKIKEEKPTKEDEKDFAAAQQDYAKQVQQLQAQQSAAAQQPPQQPGQPGTPPAPAPQMPPAPTMPKHYTVDYTVTKAGEIKVWSVPCEEFLFDREARSLDEATFVGHRRHMTRGELIALGIDEDDLEAHGGPEGKLEWNADAIARKSTTTENIGDNPEAGEANEKVLYVEGYYLIDHDGDGIAELRNICTIGPGHYPVHNEPVESRPFSLFTPYPEPHQIQGLSQAELTMDLQLVKSSLTRGMLDSFALSVYPRTTVVEGMASIEDVLNTEIGAPIRIRRDGAVQQFSHPFTGEKAMGILGYFNDIGEQRTGQDKGSMGLDADALQSSTKQAVNAAVTKSQEQIEMIARLFAEQALKPLFRGIYRLLVKHKPAPQLVRLRGEFIPIDTSSWESEMDVVVNVAIGVSLTEQRLGALRDIISEQKEILSTLGPQNPVCTLAQYSNTLRMATELAGFKDPSVFFNAVDPNWQPPQQAPQETPEQTMAKATLQVEQMRVEKDLKIKEAELTLKQQHQTFQQELELKKLAQDFTLRRYQIDAQFKADYTQQQLEMDARSEEQALSGAIQVQSQLHTEQSAARSHDLAAQQQAHEQGLAENQQAHEQDMAQRAAEAQESQAGASGDAE